jgi:hypothetical protein
MDPHPTDPRARRPHTVSVATHPESSLKRPPRARGWYTAVALVGAGALLVSACGSDSDDGTSASTEPAPATQPVADTTPSTDPPSTDPPATDPPAEGSAATTTDAPMEGLPLTQTVVAEGTAVRVEGSQINGPAAPDGRVPTSGQNIYDGDLMGEMIVTGSYLVGDDTVEVLLRGDFTGELVGVGSGTFVTESTSTMQLDDQTGEGTGTIQSGTGAFADVRGTSRLTFTEGFGDKFTYRFEFTPIQVAGEDLAAETAEAARIADEVATSFTARDFAAIQNLLGSNGTWVAIDGEVHDASTIVPFLEQFGFIETIERTDRFIEGPDGPAFEMSETYEGGGQGAFWLVVSYDNTGALVLTERP